MDNFKKKKKAWYKYWEYRQQKLWKARDILVLKLKFLNLKF